MKHDVSSLVLSVRNVHEALPLALAILNRQGVQRQSRNGPVLAAPFPVVTTYERPCERVIFWSARDANPFLHLCESLWILAGRGDVAPLLRYAKNFANYSDDGVKFHAPYGYRWRRQFGDQLAKIAKRLAADPDDRRCVLQTWSASLDLDMESKDIPCNVMLTFQRGADGELNVVVFQRSADIIWGTYGANAVQMSMLQEYVAAWIGCPVGTLTQVSVNWHAYVDVFEKMAALADEVEPVIYSVPRQVENPYVSETANPPRVRMLPLIGPIGALDVEIDRVLTQADTGFQYDAATARLSPFMAVAYGVLRAHEAWRTLAAPERFDRALAILSELSADVDWVVAAREWIGRRQAVWEAKQLAGAGA